MEGMEKVYSLLDQLAEAIRGNYPEMTSASFRVEPDGYRSIEVLKWKYDNNLPCEAHQRRELLDIHRLPNGDWSADRSDEQNEYYAVRNLLLKEG